MEIEINGICVLSGAGESVTALCEQVLKGEDVPKQIDLQKYENEISSFDTGPHELNRIQKLLLLALIKASRSAGLTKQSISSERTGIFLGNSYGLGEFKSDFFCLYKKSEPALTSPTLFPFTTANALASWLAIQVGAKGPNITFVSGSNSSAEAILAACDALIADECEMALVGGVNLLDKGLSDEFKASGFKYECVALLILRKLSAGITKDKKPAVYLRDWQRSILTKEELEKIKFEKSVLRIDNEKLRRFNGQTAEVIHLGNNLGERLFNYSKGGIEIRKENRRLSFLSEVVGNAFDAAGVMGVALSVEFLTAAQNTKAHFFGPIQDDVVCSTVDSNGSAIAMLISKR